MQRLLISLVFSLLASDVVLQATVIPGNSERGATLLRTEQCLTCHSLRGEGGSSAPDLGRYRGRGYTPLQMVSIMCNHAPVKPKLTEQQLADLFAYFHSARFFERPGDAGRGKHVFESKRCIVCHGISSPAPAGGPAVVEWASLNSTITLAQRMWNHSSKMQDAMSARNIAWPRLTSQDLTDILVYLRNLPQTRGRILEFSLSTSEDGAALLTSKGCTGCHTGKLALQNRLTAGTTTDFSVAMWNHAPQMRTYAEQKGIALPRLEPEEMRQVISYLWYTKLYAELGDPDRGRRVFSKRNCSGCHNDYAKGAPSLNQALGGRKSPFTPITMASLLWRHEKLPSRLATSELVDLMAYLNRGQR